MPVYRTVIQRKGRETKAGALLLAILLVLIIYGTLAGVPAQATGLAPNTPILINGDSSFVRSNGVGGGSGTLLDPFVIANWNISGYASMAGIEITNTAKYFTIQNVYLRSNNYGIYLYNVTNGLIQNSTIAANQHGVFLVNNTDAEVFNNNFLSNTVQANDTSGFENAWDNGYSGYSGGGNYWSDYRGVDNCSGLNQNTCPDPDGIGDAPYPIPGGTRNVDNWPLMKPYFPDVTPPLWPSGSSLTARNITPTSLTLSWNVAVDDVGVVSYTLFDGGVQLANLTGNLHAYNMTGLSASTSYTFTVKAGDRADNWSNGLNLTVTTLSQPFWLFTSQFWQEHWYLILAPIAGALTIAALAIEIRKRGRAPPLQPQAPPAAQSSLHEGLLQGWQGVFLH